MNESFDIIVKRWSLEMIRSVESFLFIKKNIFIKILSSNERES